ncbi:MAG: hypothetical protein WC509_06110 [Candidatus Izemoplasmatales bacterium]
MKIGIIFYSETGNTLGVCERARDILAGDGLDVAFIRLKADVVGNARSLRGLPPAQDYDLVILGTPVHGFSLPIPVQQYLARAQFKEGVRLGVLATQFFKADWLGGTRTVNQAVAALSRFHPDVFGTAIVHVRSRRRDEQVNAAMRALTKIEEATR